MLNQSIENWPDQSIENWPDQNYQLPVGLLAQLVERCTGIAEVMGSIPYGPEFFSGPIYNYSFQ